ncbi:MAG: class I SAM-dependent methyltransferase [Cyanobacteria bacterium J06649_11]
MKNADSWIPSKYVYKNNKLIGSRDPAQLSIASRILGDVIATQYDESLKLYAHGKLLDLGCGKVPFYLVYKSLVSKAICVDWTNTLHKNIFLDYQCDINGVLPFRDNEFDTIILSDVLEHIAEPQKLWNEISRILSPNGRLIMNTPFFYQLHEKPYDYYRFTEFALKRFASNSGLTILQLKSLGGIPMIAADLIAKSLIKLPLVGRISTIMVNAIFKLLLNTSLVKYWSRSTSVNFPIGYFLIAEKKIY